MVSTDKVMRGLVSYLENELVPNLPAKGWQRPVFATAIALASKSVEKLIDTYKTNQLLVAIGVFDNCGMVDVDTVKSEFVKQMDMEGMVIDIPLLGAVTFHKGDVEKLYTYILNA